MNDIYNKFMRRFKCVSAEKRLGYEQIAEIMNVHPNTVRNWFAGRSKMDGEAVLRCISLIMGGYNL